MKKTQHARKRMQQRGLNESIIEIILKSGRQEQTHGGAIKVFFGKQEYIKATAMIKTYQKILEKARNGILIIKDDEILTLYKNQNLNLYCQ